jgi:hypothetical protein
MTEIPGRNKSPKQRAMGWLGNLFNGHYAGRRNKWPKLDAKGWAVMIFAGLGLLFMLGGGIILGIREIFWNPEGPAPTEEIMAKYHDVDLDPHSLTPKDLFRVLCPPHYLGRVPLVTNAARAIWWRRTVEVEIRTEDLTGRQEAIYRVGIQEPFPGSLAGIHIGDPVSRLPGDPKKRAREGSYGWDGMEDWDSDWGVAWNAKGGRITRISFTNSHYIQSPVAR